MIYTHIAFAVLFLLLSLGLNSSLTTGLVLAQEEPAMISSYSPKFGSNIRLCLSQLAPDENPVVNVLLNTTETLTSEQRTRLKISGVQVRTVAGDVISASLPIRQLSELVKLDFVTYIELSRPLHPEANP